jgi:hypothetical protein
VSPQVLTGRDLGDESGPQPLSQEQPQENPGQCEQGQGSGQNVQGVVHGPEFAAEDRITFPEYTS